MKPKHAFSLRARLITLIVWIAALALIAWVLRSVPIGDVWAAISQLRGWEIAVLLLGNGLAVILFTGRWWVILRAQGWRIPYSSAVRYRLGAFGMSYFTPGSHFGGEPLQIYKLHRHHGVPLPAATASVALEKLVEMVVNLSFLAMGLAVTLQSPVFDQQPTLGALIGSLALLALPAGFLGAVWIGRHPVSWLLSMLPPGIRESVRVARLRSGIAAAEADATALCRSRPFALFEAITVSVASWLVMIAEVWLAVYFLGTALTLPELIAVITASRVAILLPSPGALGTLEAGQVWMFGALGLDPALGLSLSLVIRARDVLFGLAGLGMNLTSRFRLSGNEAAPTSPNPE